MTDYQVDIAPAAEGDIREAFGWYRDRSDGAAHDFRSEVFSAIEHIAQGSLIRAADENGTRRRILRRFPYTVMCVVNRSTITILAIAHQRRQPGTGAKPKFESEYCPFPKT